VLSLKKKLLLIYQTPRCHILEVSNLHTNSRENNFTCSHCKQFCSVVILLFQSNSGTTNCMAQSLRNQQLLSQPRNLPHFILCKVSWPFSQEYATLPILSQINPVHVIPCLLKFIFIVSSPTTSGSSN